MLDIQGVTILPGEEEKVKAAIAALEKDHHAPREISVRYTLSVHHEYPKQLHKLVKNENRSVTVHDKAGEEAAIADGFGKFTAPVAVED